jgi:hypothetical protein
LIKENVQGRGCKGGHETISGWETKELGSKVNGRGCMIGGEEGPQRTSFLLRAQKSFISWVFYL